MAWTRPSSDFLSKAKVEKAATVTRWNFQSHCLSSFHTTLLISGVHTKSNWAPKGSISGTNDSTGCGGRLAKAQRGRDTSSGQSSSDGSPITLKVKEKTLTWLYWDNTWSVGYHMAKKRCIGPSYSTPDKVHRLENLFSPTPCNSSNSRWWLFFQTVKLKIIQIQNKHRLCNSSLLTRDLKQWSTEFMLFTTTLHQLSNPLSSSISMLLSLLSSSTPKSRFSQEAQIYIFLQILSFPA